MEKGKMPNGSCFDQTATQWCACQKFSNSFSKFNVHQFLTGPVSLFVYTIYSSSTLAVFGNSVSVARASKVMFCVSKLQSMCRQNH